MKAELKAKFLQHLNQKKQDQGFTLIELLVVIIIIGILSAIALPSFLNQAAKAKQSEAKQSIGAVNRAQQAYRIENANFATDTATLGIGLPDTTANYTYAIDAKSDASTTIYTAAAKDPKSLRSMSGGVSVLTSGATAAVACQTTGVSGTAVDPTLTATGATCAKGSEPL